ncbi:MAG TPA: PPOX class F420-dependent oxidoreductase [Acidimicrobiales bacterium]|nr:PPOX class F420-dependent oxidoreductase [Acidimicrobiales bacterium]
MLHDKVISLCQAKNFAALTTLFPSGQPQTQIMWVDSDGEHVLINTEVHRAKFTNVEADPRVTVTVWDVANPYSYVEVRGRVVATVRGDEARADIDRLAQKYTGKDYASEVTSERVILKIAADRQVIH